MSDCGILAACDDAVPATRIRHLYLFDRREDDS